ncbi:MAG: CehA/McbA family metallohydrolase [Persicimonas sp.]
MSKFLFFYSLVGFALLVACGDPDPSSGADAAITQDGGADAADADASAEPDAGADARPDAGADALVRTPPQDGVGPDGHSDVSEPLAAGQARAGRIDTDQTGFTGIWAHCREGDFRLYNAQIEVCIQQEASNRFEVLTGGMIVDARRVEDTSDEVLDFVRPLLGLGTVRAESIEVVQDGSEGGPAVVRVESVDSPVAHLVGVIGNSLTDDQNVKVTTEYRLAPDSDTVEMVTWYQNPNDGTRVFPVGDWFGYGDRSQLWTPGRGMGAPQGSYGWLGSVGEHSSYGWIVPDEQATELGLSSQGLPWAGSRTRNVRLEHGDEQAWRRWFVVGDGSLELIRRRAAQLRGEADPALDAEPHTITVQTEDGDPVKHRGVLVESDDDEPMTWGRTDADGQVDLWLADGDYTLTVEAWDAGAPFEREVELPADDTLTIDTPATLTLVTADEDSLEMLTTRVVVNGGTGHSSFAANGVAQMKLAPGAYDVVVTHGPEYGAAAVSVELEAGETHEESVSLARAFDTDGWLSGDFHQHMEPSLDSTARVEKRLLENAAMDVDIAISTDHEAVTDLRPLIEELDLEGQLTTFPGVEISPLETHVGLYPMDHDREEPGNGTIRLAYLDDDDELQRRRIPEVVQMARDLPSDPVTQLNHSRRSTSGMLELVDFDPEVGPDAVDDHRFTLDFDTMEITNRFGDTCRLFADWSGLLNAGYRFTGLGNSDTHRLSGESGLPRNFLRIDKSVEEVDAADLRSALRSGQVSVGAHAFIDFADATVPGDVIETQAGEDVDLRVRVQTPDWAQADRLLVVVNGEVVDELARPDGATDVLDFDQTVSINVDEDAWVVFFADGPQPDATIGSSKPVLAFTNPVFIDVDGDTDGDGQQWEAPGVRSLSLEAVDQFCN